MSDVASRGPWHSEKQQRHTLLFPPKVFALNFFTMKTLRSPSRTPEVPQISLNITHHCWHVHTQIEKPTSSDNKKCVYKKLRRIKSVQPTHPAHHLFQMLPSGSCDKSLPTKRHSSSNTFFFFFKKTTAKQTQCSTCRHVHGTPDKLHQCFMVSCFQMLLMEMIWDFMTDTYCISCNGSGVLRSAPPHTGNNTTAFNCNLSI